MDADSDGKGTDLRALIASFLQRNFPQIAMHGGDAAIEAVDHETGEVWIQLGGACSGCGISPMTVQAIQHRLVQEIDEIELVYADTGFGSPTGGTDSRNSFPDVPF